MRRHLTFANVMVSILALIVHGGGAAYAAKKLKLKNNSVTTKKIRDGQVTGPDLAAEAVDSSKVKDGRALLVYDHPTATLTALTQCRARPPAACRR